MNTVILSGRLTKDPELRYTSGNGTAVANFTLAVNRRFKGQNEEQNVDFIQCQCWKKTAEVAAEYLKKGSKIGVVGSWQTRNFEGQDGKKVYVNECVVNELEFLDTKGSSEGNTSNNQSNYGNSSGNASDKGNTTNYNSNSNSSRSNGNDDPFADSGKSFDFKDSDLPF